jgi:hypothetical protein
MTTGRVISEVSAPATNSERLLKSFPVWPSAILALGLGLTAVWIGFLGYHLTRLIQIAI